MTLTFFLDRNKAAGEKLKGSVKGAHNVKTAAYQVDGTGLQVLCSGSVDVNLWAAVSQSV